MYMENFDFAKLPLCFGAWINFLPIYSHGCRILYAIIDTAQKNQCNKFFANESRWRKFLLAKHSMYTVVHLIHSPLSVILILYTV